MTTNVLKIGDIDRAGLAELLGRYGLSLRMVPDFDTIPGSFWGDSEAGLLASEVYARVDTPVHSLLHESCHYVCMDATRREALHTDAGGDHDEENAVCYLQILLADDIPGMGRLRMFADMDVWGYSFRLGSARRWFEEDADDARRWLIEAGLIVDDRPTFKLRE